MAHLLRGPEHTAGVTQLRVHTPGLLGPRPQLQILVGLAGAATELGVAAVSVRPVQRQVLGTSTLWLRALRVVAELLRREMLETENSSWRAMAMEINKDPFTTTKI